MVCVKLLFVTQTRFPETLISLSVSRVWIENPLGRCDFFNWFTDENL